MRARPTGRSLWLIPRTLKRRTSTVGATCVSAPDNQRWRTSLSPVDALGRRGRRETTQARVPGGDRRLVQAIQSPRREGREPVCFQRGVQGQGRRPLASRRARVHFHRFKPEKRGGLLCHSGFCHQNGEEHSWVLEGADLQEDRRRRVKLVSSYYRVVTWNIPDGFVTCCLRIVFCLLPSVSMNTSVAESPFRCSAADAQAVVNSVSCFYVWVWIGNDLFSTYERNHR